MSKCDFIVRDGQGETDFNKFIHRWVVFICFSCVLFLIAKYIGNMLHGDSALQIKFNDKMIIFFLCKILICKVTRVVVK